MVMIKGETIHVIHAPSRTVPLGIDHGSVGEESSVQVWTHLVWPVAQFRYSSLLKSSLIGLRGWYFLQESLFAGQCRGVVGAKNIYT